MSTKCLQCQYLKEKMFNLIRQYEHLLNSKDQQIKCSHQIIKQLQHKLSIQHEQTFQQTVRNEQQYIGWKKILEEQEDVIGYLKEREVELITKVMQVENEGFLKESTKINQENERNTQKCSQNLEKSNKKSKDPPVTKKNFQKQKIIQQPEPKSTNFKETILKDELRTLDIKYKVAILRAAEFATLRKPKCR